MYKNLNDVQINEEPCDVGPKRGIEYRIQNTLLFFRLKGESMNKYEKKYMKGRYIL